MSSKRTTQWINKRLLLCSLFPVNIYLLKVNNRNISKRCKICSKLTWLFLESSKIYFQDFQKTHFWEHFLQNSKFWSKILEQLALRIRSNPGCKIQKNLLYLNWFLRSSAVFFIQNYWLVFFLSCWIFEIHLAEHLRMNYSFTNCFNISFLVLIGYNMRISHV